MQKFDQYLTPSQVCQDLGICRGTAWRWIQSGKLPAIKIGRNFRIPLEPYLKVKASLVQSEDSTSPQLNQLMEEWLHHLKNGPRPFSPSTVEDYRYNFMRYLKMLGGGSSIHTVINREAFRSVLESISVEKYAFRYHVSSAVISFSKFLADKKLLQQGVVEELIALRPKRYYPPRKTVLEGDQIAKLLAAIWAGGGHNNLYERQLNEGIVRTLLLTGLRSKELCDLTLQDVDLEKKILAVRMGKGAKPRLLGINNELAKVLSGYLEVRSSTASNAFFVAEQGTPLRPNYVSHRITRLAKTAGLDITTHGLRRTFVTQAALSGRSLAIISRSVGHNHLSTTQGYLLLSEKQVIADMQGW